MLTQDEISQKIAAFEAFVEGSFSDDVVRSVRTKLVDLKNALCSSSIALSTEDELNDFFWTAIDAAYSAETTVASLPFTSD
jgi:hypothetical protein